MKQKINTIEESLHYISCRLDELTGNAMDNSYLKLDVEPTDVSGIEKSLNRIEVTMDCISDRLTDIADNLQSLSTIADALDNLTAWYVDFNNKNKNK